MSFQTAIKIGGDDRAERIKEATREGANRMSDSLKHFAKAGKILAQVKNDPDVENFQKWCEANLAFSRKTADKYIRLHGLVESGKIELESGKWTSIRQCLGIDHDGEKSTYQEKQRKRVDKRFESIPLLASKLEQHWKNNRNPDMNSDEKRIIKQSLKPIHDIYKSL